MRGWSPSTEITDPRPWRSFAACSNVAPRSLPTVETALGAEVRHGNTIHEFPDALLAALTEAYQEAVGRHRDGQPRNEGRPHRAVPHRPRFGPIDGNTLSKSADVCSNRVLGVRTRPATQRLDGCR